MNDSPSSAAPRCAICRETDRRALVDVKLADGETRVFCGTHAVMIRRLSPKTADLAELRVSLRDRRSTTDRRLETDAGDALAIALHAAFAGERRHDRDRRSELPIRFRQRGLCLGAARAAPPRA